jgi:hypothetical protein
MQHDMADGAVDGAASTHVSTQDFEQSGKSSQGYAGAAPDSGSAFVSTASFSGLSTPTQADRPPSQNQRHTIEQLMRQKGFTEDQVKKAGFPALSQLTGGRAGSASKLIEWLLRAERQII